MSTSVRTSPTADVHILEIDLWWRANREKAPDLFEQELALVFKTISLEPEAGKHYPHRSVQGVRRILMRSTRHHVYYVVKDDHVLVVAVWGAVKKVGPDLEVLVP